MYQCLLCTGDVRPIIGTKSYNLCQHLKHVYTQFYFDHIDTQAKDPLPLKRLNCCLSYKWPAIQLFTLLRL